jgi:hypothetical protein
VREFGGESNNFGLFVVELLFEFGLFGLEGSDVGRQFVHAVLLPFGFIVLLEFAGSMLSQFCL